MNSIGALNNRLKNVVIEFLLFTLGVSGMVRHVQMNLLKKCSQTWDTVSSSIIGLTTMLTKQVIIICLIANCEV